MGHGTWNMEHGTWDMEHGTWDMEHGTWDMCMYINADVNIVTALTAYSDSKYCFAVKNNRVWFRIKFYCYQILHSSNYFSTYSPPLLRHLS